MAIRKEEEKKAIDNITYKMDKEKKTDDMLFAKFIINQLGVIGFLNLSSNVFRDKFFLLAVQLFLEIIFKLDLSTKEELEIVKKTTVANSIKLNPILTGEEIIKFQNVLSQLPVTNNVLEYAVTLVAKTRPDSEKSVKLIKDYVEWGAGPRASQYMIIAAKCHAAKNGKYAPDIEDVKAVALPILRHRIVKNYKAEAEGMSVDDIINSIL